MTCCLICWAPWIWPWWLVSERQLVYGHWRIRLVKKGFDQWRWRCILRVASVPAPFPPYFSLLGHRLLPLARGFRCWASQPNVFSLRQKMINVTQYIALCVNPVGHSGQSLFWNVWSWVQVSEVAGRQSGQPSLHYSALTGLPPDNLLTWLKSFDVNQPGSKVTRVTSGNIIVHISFHYDAII